MRHRQFSSGFVVHALLALLIVCFLRPAPAVLPMEEQRARTLVWASPAGGGTRGGDGSKAAPAARTQPPVRPPQFILPTTPVASAILELPGIMTVLAAADVPGSGADDGKGKGRGDGPGVGTEKGPAGAGDGALPPGTPGLVDPVVVFEKKPEFTSAALAASLQGSVLLEVVVLPDGSVGRVRIVRSLDPQLGLDQKAIDAVRQWRFRPATHYGKPVAVPVMVELTFRLH